METDRRPEFYDRKPELFGNIVKVLLNKLLALYPSCERGIIKSKVASAVMKIIHFADANKLKKLEVPFHLLSWSHPPEGQPPPLHLPLHHHLPTSHVADSCLGWFYGPFHTVPGPSRFSPKPN